MNSLDDLLTHIGKLQGNQGLFRYMANKTANFKKGIDTVFYAGPFWDTREVEAAVRSLIEGKWLSSGESVMKFERKFSKQFGFKESLMVNSGSSANLIMLAAIKKVLGWKDGDEVIVSVVGFPTTINPIIQNNLKPVFVDISFEDLNWNLDQVAGAITSKTRAVLSSPVLGNPYNFDRLLDIVETYGIEIISDNCDSLGSKWKGRFLTEFSLAASCSFYPAHHITTMEGGMVSSNNEEIIKTARSLAWWGRDCYCVGAQNLLPEGTCKNRFSKWIPDCDVVLDHKFIYENIGYNLKPLDLQGAIGIVQLEKIHEIESKRRLNKDRIHLALSSIPGVRVIGELESAHTSWFGVPVVCESKLQKYNLVRFLESRKIQTRNYFAGNILQQPAYRSFGDYRNFPEASKVLEQVFFVGCSPTITSEMLDYIDEVVGDYCDLVKSGMVD